MTEKLRRLLVPLFLLAAALAIGLALLNWLVLTTGWPALDADVGALWLPGLLAAILTALVVAPRLHILALKVKYDIAPLYLIAAFVGLAGPAILMQKYVQAATGSIATVADAAAITAHPDARYYVAGSLCLDRAHTRSHTVVTASGDHDEYFDVDLYLAVPLCGAPRLWLGYAYDTRIAAALGDAEKDALYDAFVKRHVAALNAEDPRRYRYLEKLRPSGTRRAFLKALKGDDSDTLLVPHTEPFAPRGANFLGGALLAFAAAIVLWTVMIFVAPLVPLAARKPVPRSPAAMLVIPSREVFGLPLLLDINVLVYLAMVFSGLGVMHVDLDDLIAWGASAGRLDHGLGLVRLVTAMFVHDGFFHILGNMYGLLVAALFLSPVARNLRVVICYLVCGIGGSLLSAVVHPEIVSVGASGAVFGLFGVLLALIGLRDAKMVPLTKVVLVNVGIYLALNVVYGVTTPGVDNFAHLGGFLAGLVCGATLYALDRRAEGRAGPPA